MKAKDLRKGNIVKNDKLDIFKKNYIILSARDIYNLAVFESAQSVDDKYKCFEPIRITEEWLLKFGANKTIINNKFYEYNIACTPIGYKADYVLSFRFINDKIVKFWWRPVMGGDMHSFKCDFIHELQNLYFALTGVELVISE